MFGLFGKLFDKGKFLEITNLYKLLNKSFSDRFYIEIQRHNDQNELGFEKFNLSQSKKIQIPIILKHMVWLILPKV